MYEVRYYAGEVLRGPVKQRNEQLYFDQRLTTDRCGNCPANSRGKAGEPESLKDASIQRQAHFGGHRGFGNCCQRVQGEAGEPSVSSCGLKRLTT